MEPTGTSGEGRSAATLLSDYIPVISLGRSDQHDPDRRADVVNAVESACLTKGFFLIVDHGVDTRVTDAMYEATRALFAAPVADRLQLAVDPADPLIRGIKRRGDAQT